MKFKLSNNYLKFLPNDQSGLIAYSKLSGDTHFLILDGLRAKELFLSEFFTKNQIDSLNLQKNSSQSLFNQMFEKKIIIEANSK